MTSADAETDSKPIILIIIDVEGVLTGWRQVALFDGHLGQDPALVRLVPL